METERRTEAPGPTDIKARVARWWQRGATATAEGAQVGAEAGALARWLELAAYGTLVLMAAGLRLWELGARAMHHDESLHAYYSWNLATGKGYEHTPMMHGPFQFHANAAIYLAFGDTDFTARLLYVIMGTALVGLPYFLRDRLGRLGALLAAVMLTFSPAMFYFSRFARNDILMAFWVLGLVACMWRYIDEGKHRYLYIGSALLALAFATKETAYLATFILCLFLALLLVSRGWPSMQGRIAIEGVSPPVALGRVVGAVWAALRELKLSQVSRPAGFLVLIITLMLPQWSAAVSLLQDTPLLSWSHLVLATPEGGVGFGQIGAPSGGGLVVAFLVVLALLAASIVIGARWDWPVWWRCAIIFYVIWVLLYTTFFTNIVGIGSGMWQSMGYWIVQQGEARGNQPWYYYFVLTSIYEFLPLIFGVVAGVYYLRRRDVFGHFLVFWAGVTFLLYTIASEKMPWLLVNIALPLIVLSAKFIADIVQKVQWKRLVSGGGLFLLLGVPLFLAVAWRLAFYGVSGQSGNVGVLLSLLVSLLALAALGAYLARRISARDLAAFAAIPVALVLLALTIRTGARAAYQNGDVPVEMIVYTQTSPDLLRLSNHIKQIAKDTGRGMQLPVLIDSTSGFTWPWAWYLRDYTGVGYAAYDTSPMNEAPNTSVLLVHANNYSRSDPLLRDLYTEGVRIKHRWWFPEDTYRGLTPGKFLRSFGDRQAWRRAMDYFLYRKLGMQTGSEDSYVYFAKDLNTSFTPVWR